MNKLSEDLETEIRKFASVGTGNITIKNGYIGSIHAPNIVIESDAIYGDAHWDNECPGESCPIISSNMQY